MKITKKQFLADVMHEIDALKANADENEINKLNFENFDPISPSHCIYGQMTGNCCSPRAKELMDKCCIRELDLTKIDGDINERDFIEVKEMVNGAYSGRTWRNDGNGRSYYYLSSLEGYIQLGHSKNKGIIAYLKGERKTLSL